MEKASQLVYVLTNAAMPGLVKIGKTSRLAVDDRTKQLYSTGVPVPFDCAFACQVRDAPEVEKALHVAFGNCRINPNREFFRIEPERVIAVLRLLKVDEVTAQFEQALDAETNSADKASADALRRERRPPLNFHELGIANGSVLTAKDGTMSVTVVDEKKVSWEGKITSLTAATRRLRHLPDDYPIQPSPYWLFNGQSLIGIYEAYHDSE
jgi:T5orf172 domain